MACWKRVASGKAIELDSLGFNLAGLAVLMSFVHNNVTHGRFEFVVRVAVAEVLEGLL